MIYELNMLNTFPLFFLSVTNNPVLTSFFHGIIPKIHTHATL